MSSTFGKLLKLTTFGESHGEALGGILDGFPANFPIDLSLVQQELDRRKPGQSAIVTQRKENDTFEFLSGIFEGKTTGTPIAFMVRNTNERSEDYSEIKDAFRPSHADFTYQQKYGIRDYRGGGRSSARETVARVIAGALAKQFLATKNIFIDAFVDQVGAFRWNETIDFEQLSSLRETRDKNPVRVPNEALAIEMETLIRETRKEGDTIGGCIRCVIHGLPVGLGEPVFDKFHADLGKAMLSINAVKGFTIGSGFDGVSMKGSEHNDVILTNLTTETNFSGGVQGGITNGMPVDFRVAFKPVATIMKSQKTVDSNFEETELKGKGRHDACVVPRAVPIVESMAALTVLDFLLLQNAYANLGK